MLNINCYCSGKLQQHGIREPSALAESGTIFHNEPKTLSWKSLFPTWWSLRAKRCGNCLCSSCICTKMSSFSSSNVMKGWLSNYFCSSKGAPQGSVLGPLLFLICGRSSCNCWRKPCITIFFRRRCVIVLFTNSNGGVQRPKFSPGRSLRGEILAKTYSRRGPITLLFSGTSLFSVRAYYIDRVCKWWRHKT